MERFDVLVLGGGAAGCALAGRLSEEPDRTVDNSTAWESANSERAID